MDRGYVFVPLSEPCRTRPADVRIRQTRGRTNVRKGNGVSRGDFNAAVVARSVRPAGAWRRSAARANLIVAPSLGAGGAGRLRRRVRRPLSVGELRLGDADKRDSTGGLTARRASR